MNWNQYKMLKRDVTRIMRYERSYSRKISLAMNTVDYGGHWKHLEYISDHHLGFSNARNPLPWNWEQIRKQVLERDGWKCTACGRTDHLHVHHIVPRSAGGSDELDNLTTLCVRCHSNQHPMNAQLRAIAEKQVGKVQQKVHITQRVFKPSVTVKELLRDGVHRGGGLNK